MNKADWVYVLELASIAAAAYAEDIEDLSAPREAEFVRIRDLIETELRKEAA